VLHFLVNDTHYHNLFETSTTRGNNCIRHRSAWEDRIFNGLYKNSHGVDCVKYGVLNVSM
jgi:hypothetical protein